MSYENLFIGDFSDDDKNKIYRLVIANDTDVPEEVEFHIDIAFADDFGFDL